MAPLVEGKLSLHRRAICKGKWHKMSLQVCVNNECCERWGCAAKNFPTTCCIEVNDSLTAVVASKNHPTSCCTEVNDSLPAGVAAENHPTTCCTEVDDSLPAVVADKIIRQLAATQNLMTAHLQLLQPCPSSRQQLNQGPNITTQGQLLLCGSAASRHSIHGCLRKMGSPE